VLQQPDRRSVHLLAEGNLGILFDVARLNIASATALRLAARAACVEAAHLTAHGERRRRNLP
jgi:hypothetical protein